MRKHAPGVDAPWQDTVHSKRNDHYPGSSETIGCRGCISAVQPNGRPRCKTGLPLMQTGSSRVAGLTVSHSTLCCCCECKYTAERGTAHATSLSTTQMGNHPSSDHHVGPMRQPPGAEADQDPGPTQQYGQEIEPTHDGQADASEVRSRLANL